MELHYLLVNSLKDSKSPRGRCVSKAFSNKNNHPSTARFDMDKKRKIGEVLEHRKVWGSTCQWESVQHSITWEPSGTASFAGGMLLVYNKAVEVLCCHVFQRQGNKPMHSRVFKGKIKKGKRSWGTGREWVEEMSMWGCRAWYHWRA